MASTTSPSLHLIIGCMFSGKTTEIIRLARRYQALKVKTLLLNYHEDTRYLETDSPNDTISPHRMMTHDLQGIPAIPLDSFKNFLFPGLIMMTIIQNAFMNNSSSILMSKVQGNIVDLLMPPLSNVEIILAFTLAGITRGLASAVACALVMMPFIEVTVYNLWIILIFAILASAIMSLIGMISGIWAEKWDHLGTVGNFVIVPLSFLSGTFYSITVLPDAIQRASLINPFFYMIDGFRFGFLGASDSSISHAFTILIIVLISLIVINYLMLKTGYKLRA